MWTGQTKKKNIVCYYNDAVINLSLYPFRPDMILSSFSMPGT